MNQPLVSVIVPIYNTEKKYLSKCLDGIANQNYKNIEIILVDDGSTSKTANFIDEYVFNLNKNKWKVIHQKNKGLSSARNSGYKVAKGKYIQFLDSDDYFDKELISGAVNIAEETEAEIVIENFIVEDHETGSTNQFLNLDLFPREKTFSLRDLKYSKFQTIPYNVWSKLFKKEFLDSLNLLHDETLYRSEDVVYSYSALLLANRIGLMTDPCIIYRDNLPNSNTSTNDPFPLASVMAWKKIFILLTQMNVYASYKSDFEQALCDSIYWHLLKMHTASAVKALGEAAYEFMSEIDSQQVNERSVAIMLASIDHDAFLLFESIVNEKTTLLRENEALKAKLKTTQLMPGSLSVITIKDKIKKMLKNGGKK